MTIKQLALSALLAVVVAYLLLIVMMTPVHATSGSGEGNVFTTQAP